MRQMMVLNEMFVCKEKIRLRKRFSNPLTQIDRRSVTRTGKMPNAVSVWIETVRSTRQGTAAVVFESFQLTHLEEFDGNNDIECKSNFFLL